MRVAIAILAMCWLLMGSAYGVYVGTHWGNEFGTPAKKFCPVCREEVKKSMLWCTDSCYCLAIACIDSWGEDGNKDECPNPCHCSRECQCSNGHRWSE